MPIDLETVSRDLMRLRGRARFDPVATSIDVNDIVSVLENREAKSLSVGVAAVRWAGNLRAGVESIYEDSSVLNAYLEAVALEMNLLTDLEPQG